jgi:hypothetical protein
VTANSKIGSENCVSADPEINSENCLAADPEIGSQNRVVADSEIGNEKLCRYRFTNQLPKLHRCGFGNRQPETVSLPIRKSAARNYVTANSEINNDGGVISALLLSFFMCLHCVTKLPPGIQGGVSSLIIKLWS